MRLAATSIPLLFVVLAGCAALGPPPDVSALPHATIVGSHTPAEGRIDTFRTIAIDGRAVLGYSDEPAKLIKVDEKNLVAAGRPVRVEIEGMAFYDNTVRRLFWSPMRAQGVVEFVPAAGATYSLHGSITPQLSSVWIENDATHEVVGNKVSAVGQAATAPAPAASDADE
ncbi:MAG: hypothetical protein JF586_02990 [Burkholderiales bacterium]|jgi:hypothetical protein|nr:hypothetical protein [Burkholderiales bacterium]